MSLQPKTLLELGRVSNLPTVWSNVLTGAALSGASLSPAPLAIAGLAGSLFYVGGMFLNDAFDAEIDARERPERPIPSGRATRRQVFAIGTALLGGGLALLALSAALGSSPSGLALPAAGLATALAVVFYDRFHKGVAWSPLVMGLCRAGLYVIGALSVSPHLPELTLLGAGALLLYVVGLTHIARFETASAVGRLWPTALLFTPVSLTLARAEAGGGLDPILLGLVAVSAGWTLRALRFARQGGRNIGRAVVTLIAGISFVDAAFSALAGARVLAGFAFACAVLTLLGQKKIRGT